MKTKDPGGVSRQGTPPLGRKEIHLYLIDRNCSYAGLINHSTDITPEERDVADSFKFEEGRKNYIVSRSALRNILSAYINCRPTEIRFEYGAYGKPYLDKRQNPQNIRFNSTGSADLTVIGVALDDEIGVDIERIRPLPDLKDLIKTTFSRFEQQEFEKESTPANRAELYMRYWTHKEAYLKATGQGLSCSPQNIEFQYQPEGLSLFRASGDDNVRTKWETCYLRVHGYGICVAAPPGRKIIKLF